MWHFSANVALLKAAIVLLTVFAGSDTFVDYIMHTAHGITGGITEKVDLEFENICLECSYSSQAANRGLSALSDSGYISFALFPILPA